MKNLTAGKLPSAMISPCNKYRYLLSRQWDAKLPYLLFIGLNPSTADAQHDDPTTNKLIHLAKSWNYGGVIIVNLYAYIDSHQKVIWSLSTIEEKLGPDNRETIQALIQRDDIGMILAGWGDDAVTWRGGKIENDQYYQEIANLYHFITETCSRELYCLSYNNSGMPRNPAYSKVPYPSVEYIIPELYQLTSLHY